MEPTFKILSPDTIAGEPNLFIEINLWGVTYIVTGNDNACTALFSYHFPAESNFERAAVYIKQSVAAEPLLQQSFGKITVVYAYPSAMLAPNALMNGTDNKKMLELVYGDVNDAYVRSDFSYKYQLHTIYTIPKPVDAVVSYLFSSANTRHQYGMLRELFTFEGNHLYCIFGNNHFTVQLIKNGQLQATQSYAFKAPEDISYYLLQLCAAYDVPVATVLLQLNGMISVSSALYNELCKYFLNIQLQSLPQELSYPQEIDQYPAHYFSHLFQMVLCV